MKIVTYENIQDVLDEEFPEYKEIDGYDDTDRGLQYVYVGNFASYVLAALDTEQGKIPLAERLLKLTDEIINDIDSSDELINLLGIEVFENLVASRMGAVLAKRYLHGRSIEVLGYAIRYCGSKEFVDEYRV